MDGLFSVGVDAVVVVFGVAGEDVEYVHLIISNGR